MNNCELKTEQIILEAAEAEFLEKGFGNAKMMAIAKRANVAHSMLHYYFRSKENLFQTIFLNKAQRLLPLFESVFERHLPFFETVRLLMETQFDFLAANPKIPLFLLNEISTNKKNRALLLDVLLPKIMVTMSKLKEALDEEVKKGNVRPVRFHNFMMNILSMNASTFLVFPILHDITGEDEKTAGRMYAERRESNIQFTLAGLKI